MVNCNEGGVTENECNPGNSWNSYLFGRQELIGILNSLRGVAKFVVSISITFEYSE